VGYHTRVVTQLSQRGFWPLKVEVDRVVLVESGGPQSIAALLRQQGIRLGQLGPSMLFNRTPEEQQRDAWYKAAAEQLMPDGPPPDAADRHLGQTNPQGRGGTGTLAWIGAPGAGGRGYWATEPTMAAVLRFYHQVFKVGDLNKSSFSVTTWPASSVEARFNIVAGYMCATAAASTRQRGKRKRSSSRSSSSSSDEEEEEDVGASEEDESETVDSDEHDNDEGMAADSATQEAARNERASARASANSS